MNPALNKALEELRTSMELLEAEHKKVKNLPKCDKRRAEAMGKIMMAAAQVVSAYTALASNTSYALACKLRNSSKVIGPSDSGNGVVVSIHTNSESS